MSAGVKWTEAEVAAVLARMGRNRTPSVASEDAPRSKYGAKKTEYRGTLYDSKAESRMAAQLDVRVAAGELLRWEGQSKVVIVWPGSDTVVMRCRLDFKLFWPDGRETYLEVKGCRVRDWPLRERLLRAAGVTLDVQYPGGNQRRKRGGP